MKVIFCSKYSQSYEDFENAKKFPENVDSFEDNYIRNPCGSFCQLWQECMCAAVNVLKSGAKISDPTKRNDTQPNVFDINGTLA